MPTKVCPRCGALYQNLKSVTCPQCFAVLEPVDDATAEELAAARAEVEQTPEFQEAKAADNERFKEQSFGACLGVFAITVATLVFAVILIVSAAHRHHPPAPNSGGVRVGLGPVPDPLTTLPVAAAGLDEVMPPQLSSALGELTRTASDQDLILPGTLTHIDHAIYAANDQTINAYAIPTAESSAEQNQFRLSVTLAAQMERTQAAPVFFATQYWHYATISSINRPDDSAKFERVLAAYFRMTEQPRH
jgi:hypothetical protein